MTRKRCKGCGTMHVMEKRRSFHSLKCHAQWRTRQPGYQAHIDHIVRRSALVRRGRRRQTPEYLQGYKAGQWDAYKRGWFDCWLSVDNKVTRIWMRQPRTTQRRAIGEKDDAA